MALGNNFKGYWIKFMFATLNFHSAHLSIYQVIIKYLCVPGITIDALIQL